MYIKMYVDFVNESKIIGFSDKLYYLPHFFLMAVCNHSAGMYSGPSL